MPVILPNPWLYVVCANNIPLGSYCTREAALDGLYHTDRFGEVWTMYESEDHTILGWEVDGFKGEIVVQKLCFSVLPHDMFRG